MTALRRLSPTLALLLIAAAVLLRAGLPAGWMPAAGSDGIHLEVCSGGLATTMVLGADGKLHRDTPVTPHDPCPFGLVAGAALDIPPVATLAEPFGIVRPLLWAGALAAARVARQTPRPPSQGPPPLA